MTEKFEQPPGAIHLVRSLMERWVVKGGSPGTMLRLTLSGGLYSMRFGEFDFDMKTTDLRTMKSLFAEEHFALSCGLNPEEIGSGWHKRN